MKFEDELKKIDNFLTSIKARLENFNVNNIHSQITNDFYNSFKIILNNECHKHSCHKQLIEMRTRIRGLKEQLKIKDKKNGN